MGIYHYDFWQLISIRSVLIYAEIDQVHDLLAYDYQFLMVLCPLIHPVLIRFHQRQHEFLAKELSRDIFLKPCQGFKLLKL